MMSEKVIVAWSGGKDAAQAFYELQHQGEVEIVSLLTTVTEGYDRISMHGVRRALVNEQAEALGYPLEEIAIPRNCTDEIYEQRMRQSLERFQAEGISAVALAIFSSRTCALIVKSA
jgi:diphthamide synthase (EF-2-diphthine--ammonia ligase)